MVLYVVVRYVLRPLDSYTIRQVVEWDKNILRHNFQYSQLRSKSNKGLTQTITIIMQLLLTIILLLGSI